LKQPEIKKPLLDKKEEKPKAAPKVIQKASTTVDAVKAGVLECLLGSKWRKRYYVLHKGGDFVEFDKKDGKQMSLTKIKSGVIFKEHQDPTEKEGESMISKSFQILIPPDTDIVLKATSVEEMHSWLNVLQKESLSKEDLQAISDENGFQGMVKNANFIPKPFTLKFLSCEDVGVTSDINEKHKKSDGRRKLCL